MARAAFEPLTIGGVTVANRIFRPAHQLVMCPGGRVNERFIAYHEARARGGTGLLILEATAVHPISAGYPDLLTIWDDEAIEGLSRLRKRIAPTPAKLFIQLWHAGNNVRPWDGSPPWSASDATGFASGIPAIPMTQWMIDEVIEAYRLAALRAVTAGLEGIEIHAAHGYLAAQFLSPALNNRTDKYGGPFENRVRFLVEVMRAIRGSVPKGFVIGVRLSSDMLPGNYGPDEIGKTIELLQAEKISDYFNLSMGNYVTAEYPAGAMHETTGYQLPVYRHIRHLIKLPLLVTGRFRTIDEIDQVLRAGDADMVGMVRAQIADPDLVRKTREGRVEEVRPCIACNQVCIAGIVTGTPIGCAVNVAAGREETLGEEKFVPAKVPRKVLVIGGGVSGMEAARVAARRGHKVTLFEASANLGGTVRFVSTRAPKMLSFGDITHWQESELRRLGVEIRSDSFVEAADVKRENPDFVILASGSTPRLDGWQRQRPGCVLPGTDKPHVMSSVDVLSAPPANLGKTALVQDDVGHYEGIAVAEYLINLGISVTFVTRFPMLAPLMEVTLRTGPAYTRLNRSGKFSLRVRSTLQRIDDSTVTLFDEIFDAKPETVPAETVVLVTYNHSNSALQTELEGLNIKVKAVGDALSPRYLEAAIRDGYMAALQI